MIDFHWNQYTDERYIRWTNPIDFVCSHLRNDRERALRLWIDPKFGTDWRMSKSICQQCEWRRAHSDADGSSKKRRIESERKIIVLETIGSSEKPRRRQRPHQWWARFHGDNRRRNSRQSTHRLTSSSVRCTEGKAAAEILNGAECATSATDRNLNLICISNSPYHAVAVCVLGWNASRIRRQRRSDEVDFRFLSAAFREEGPAVERFWYDAHRAATRFDWHAQHSCFDVGPPTGS